MKLFTWKKVYFLIGGAFGAVSIVQFPSIDITYSLVAASFTSSATALTVVEWGHRTGLNVTMKTSLNWLKIKAKTWPSLNPIRRKNLLGKPLRTHPTMPL